MRSQICLPLFERLKEKNPQWIYAPNTPSHLTRRQIIYGSTSITLILWSPPATLTPTLILITSVVIVFPASGLIGDLGDDIGQEVEHLILSDGLFEMGGRDAL